MTDIMAELPKPFKISKYPAGVLSPGGCRHTRKRDRKEEHPQFVPNCRKETNGTCQFGAHNCWFKHIEIENSNEHTNIDKNQELIGKLFNMVEKFTQRILELEEKVK